MHPCRTLPENDIEWIVTEDGQFRMSWLKKVAAYDEDARVTLWLEKLLPNGSVAEEHHAGTALEATAPKLELGATYDVYVTDDDTGERYGPFHVEAYPNCTRGTECLNFC